MDRTPTSVAAGFEGIAQMLLEQKKVMEALEAENRELRHQLEEVRQGAGISVHIEGKPFKLVPSTDSDQAKGASEKNVLPETQGGERRDNGNTPRSPLTDSYVL